MTDFSDFSQLCRLCLVEDDVNHSIFGETGEFGGLFRKITSCLPVSINKNDGLPVRICDTCSTKLDSFYQFRNETIKAEKQLLQWFHKNNSMRNEEGCMNTTVIKEEENIDYNEGSTTPETNNYTMMSKEIIYPTSTSKDEPPPSKRPKRASAMKALEHLESEDDDFDDNDYGKGDSDDDTDKDGSYQDEGPSTSMNDQPGPSGMGKGSSQAPYNLRGCVKTEQGCIGDKIMKKRASNSNWCCKKCSEEFSTRKLLQAHRKIHQKREESPTSKALNNYKYNETQDLYVCNFCSAECLDEDEIQKHLTNNHLTQFTCKICMENFTEPYRYSVHTQKHNKNDHFFCPLCSYKTPRMTGIQTHINRMHLNKFIYNCKTCGKGFNDQAIFKEHDNEHLGIKPFTCVVCNKSYVFSKYLYAHQVRYHVVKIEGVLQNNQCGICMRIFAKDTTLERHMKARHGNNGVPREKKLLCDICGQRFSRNDKLKIHYRIHTGVKPYACSYCPKSFIKKEYLVMHERVHNGERPFECKFCGKSFNQSAPLRIHIRGHTGERPYVCQFCEQGFISRSALNFHRKNYCAGRQDDT